MTVADLIQRYIEEKAQKGRRQMGKSQAYTLKLLARSAIGKVQAAKLMAIDFIDHCTVRRAAGIQPATIKQDMTFLVIVLKHAENIWEIEGVSLAAWNKAKTQLANEQLIAKSRPRTRRPKLEELERIEAFFRSRNEDPRTKIPMDVITRFSYLTARRISETCRLRRGDVNLEKRTCIVRDLKNPKGKGEHGEFPLLGEAWDIVQERFKVIADHPDARLFAYNSHSCSACYTDAKKKLGIAGLRLHDNRREAISRMFERGFNVPEVAKLSLHKNPSMLLNVYTALKPEDLHLGPASQRLPT